jgi:predicted nucleic acid-binding protein
LKSLDRQDHWPEVWGIYAVIFHNVITTGEDIAHMAVQLRASTPDRLPTIDALIAATAVAEGLTLVHRDPHLTAVAHAELMQMFLPDK